MPPGSPRAFITGITGQDGSYLAEFLLERGYEVFGLIRPTTTGQHMGNIEHIAARLHLIRGDMTDADSLERALEQADPQEVYNLAAQSFVPASWDSPAHTLSVNLFGLTYLLEAIRNRKARGNGQIAVYQASTSEMYGNAGYEEAGLVNHGGHGLDEESPMRPRSPYGVSKLAAHRLARVYRQSFGIPIWCGVMFNHESPRRGEMFVTRKVAKAVARIFTGKQKRLLIGDLSVRRDWGFARDYVEAMWTMLQQVNPDDFVIGTGRTHSIEDLIDTAWRAAHAFMSRPHDIRAIPAGARWPDYVTKDPALIRPAEIFTLRADASKARAVLGWRPTMTFTGLVHFMVKKELIAEGWTA